MPNSRTDRLRKSTGPDDAVLGLVDQHRRKRRAELGVRERQRRRGPHRRAFTSASVENRPPL